jgi:VCBS repeat-containing protein
VDSGLNQGLSNIYLHLIGGVVVGSTEANEGDVDASNTVFDVSVDANGVVTLTQYSEISHPLQGGLNDAPFADQIASMTDDLITLTASASITDNDGDTDEDSATINIGANLQFADHGPVATNDVDEITSGGDTAEGNVITGVGTNGGTLNADVVGADTPGRVSGVVSVNEPGNTDQDADPNVFEIDGEFGTLVLNADGSYTYTRFDGAPGNSQDVFTYTLIDADGDTDTATLTINIGDAAPNLPDPAAINLDDDVIPAAGGNLDGPGDDNPDTVPGNVVNGDLNGTGGDGTLTYNFTGVDTLPTGFSIGAGSDADTLLIVQDQGGSDVVVMTIQLDQSNGEFSVTQNAPIRHDPTNPGAGAGQEDNFEDNLTFLIGVEVEDADHDVEPATITIHVDDDTPTINVTKGAGAEPVLTTDDADTIGVNFDTAVSAANFGGLFGLTQSPGADGAAAAATLGFALDVTGYAGGPAGVNSNLESHDVDIFLYEIGGKVVGSTSATLAGVTDDNTVFDVAVDSDGIVTLTQYQQIDHDTADPTPTGPGFADHIVSLADGLVTLTASATLTDNDGDEISDSEVVAIGANLRFTDDGPDANTSATAVGTVTLDESRPVTTDTPGGTLPAGLDSATIDFSVNFVKGASVDYGADGPGSVSYALLLSGANVPSGLFALDPTDTVVDGDGYGQGGQIVLNQSGNVITGSFDGTDYFTLTMDPATGIVTFAQINPIWHPTPGSSFDEAATLNTALATNIQVVQTVTDFDGDTDTASINIGRGVFIIQDDGPNAIQPDAITEGLNNEAGATATADLDDDGEVITDFGEDGPGLVTFANIEDGDDSGFTSDDDAITYWLSDNGQTLEGRTNSTDGTDGELVFTVAIDQAAGEYTVTMAGTIDNGAGVTFNNLTSTKAGNVDVRGVGADDPLTTVDLLLTASANGANATINTSSSTVGSANQSMNEGETIRIDFVTNLEDDPTDTLATFPSGFSYDGHVGTSSYLQLIPQVQGDQSQTVAFRVYALNTTVTDAGSPDDTPGAGLTPFSDSTTIQITHVTIDGYNVGETPVTVAIGAVGVWTTVAYGVSAQLQADGSVIFTGVQEGDRYGIETGADFNAVAVSSLAAGIGPVGNLSSTNAFDLGVFAIGSVDTGDPIQLTYDLNITDADGDTVTMVGAIDITIDPAGTPAPLAAATASFSQESFEQSSLLVSESNDQQRTMSAANNNSVLLGAIAAAGLGAGSSAAARDFAPSDFSVDSQLVAGGGWQSQTLSLDSGGASRTALGGETKVAVEDLGAASSSARQPADFGQNSLTHGQGDHGQAPTALLQGTQLQQSAPVESSFTSASVGMPSAEMLAAANLNIAEGLANSNAEVGRVLADALAGGAQGSNIDAVIDAVAGAGGGAHAALEAIASHGGAAVPAWHMADMAGFMGGHSMPTMEIMVIHPDTAPQAA